MADWTQLPTDILTLIFQYFQVNTLLPAESSLLLKRYALIPTDDLLRCLYPCKNWSILAQRMLYKTIVLKEWSQLEKFTYTLSHTDSRGLFVEHIYINFNIDNIDQALVEQISKIGDLCIHLKTLFGTSLVSTSPNYYSYSNSLFPSYRLLPSPLKVLGAIKSTVWWDLIEHGRKLGHFSKLEVMPFEKQSDLLDYYNVIKYYKACFVLRHTLRELAIYSKLPNETKLSQDYPNVKFVNFYICTGYDMNLVDQVIKDCLSVNSIAIQSINLYRARVSEGIPVIHACPHVKSLYVGGNSAYDDSVYQYVMKAFPSLDFIQIGPVPDRDVTSMLLPTNLTVQFIQYLTNIPVLYPCSMIVQNINEVMIELLDTTKNNIKRLKLVFEMPCSSFFSANSTKLTLSWEAQKSKMRITVLNSPDDGQQVIPCSNSIERRYYGKNIEYLDIEFGYDSPDDASDDRLYEMVLNCPNLKELRINYSMLQLFGSGRVLKPRAEYEHLEIKNSFMMVDFLPHLSSSVSFIKTFTVLNCHLQVYPESTCIDMPYTIFDSITVVLPLETYSSIYLELNVMAHDSLVWYVMQKDGGLQECTEDKFLNPTEQPNYALKIRCKDVKEITNKIGGIDISISF
ncbi:hypothetical protein BD770DRAFT_390652 [Pilaira anomala]|nr:hypothetical protein BD770DRAFT_390652 [Pilaira anomala]